MASLNLTQEELKAFELSRQRLAQLAHSIGSLKNNVLKSNPLPDLDSLQASADILQHNLRYLSDILAQHNDVFNRVVVHPSTNFPGRTQENVLLQLLRKKPEPDVAAAMDEGRETVARLVSPSPAQPAAAQGSQGNQGGSKDLAAAEQQRKQKTKELEDTWSAAREYCIERVTQYATEYDDDPYTEEEREVAGIASVRTGLRKPIPDPYGEEDEDEDGDEQEGDDDVMIVDRPPPPPAPAVAAPEVEGASLENILRLSARGEFLPT